ncbi:octanoyl-[GcvH]:protein N-octanoyltransferase [Terribacillus saccharophilus]|uniref:Octanoyl-[GcvH]:protein N-octanoyltransferase n=1 Tax=Terribacillus saccharophilus TaxID=361277 RepID=A0AAX2EFV0_9BACI|nr:lipoate--protein ligase family protein [Terribacillus saccharophilus]MEC0291293.1 lipoate--protein ligase family protein [Terribacillus saccharophilus]SEN35098.1 octanoyl-[GcvH]:protein N-octanoyltransferase [Terribacillus saccharophilus]
MLHTLFKTPEFRIIDHSGEDGPEQAMASFAIDDALAISVGENLAPPTARLWIHDRTIMLGIPDSRLPYIKEGISYLQEKGYKAVVRNSGGLAVLLDKGVVNLSFIFPDAKHIGIHDGYQAMVSFIQYIFQDLTDKIEAFEIVGSYCPGTYDLSIDGRKFAGISQRRVKDGSAVQIYLCVDGSGAARAEIVQGFYERAKKDAETRFTFPDVVPETMASLEELLQVSLTSEQVCKRIVDGLASITHIDPSSEMTVQEAQLQQERMKLMRARNENFQ